MIIGGCCEMLGKLHNFSSEIVCCGWFICWIVQTHSVYLFFNHLNLSLPIFSEKCLISTFSFIFIRYFSTPINYWNNLCMCVSFFLLQWINNGRIVLLLCHAMDMCNQLIYYFRVAFRNQIQMKSCNNKKKQHQKQQQKQHVHEQIIVSYHWSMMWEKKNTHTQRIWYSNNRELTSEYQFPLFLLVNHRSSLKY